jgi:hypothetical protein
MLSIFRALMDRLRALFDALAGRDLHDAHRTASVPDDEAECAPLEAPQPSNRRLRTKSKGAKL